ncbi:hypothetical protein A2Z00_04385 [Candidatus Gottesmanbacteria bacterium RBG_13_45_10]|uniref:HAD family hydrolase n=1 Tax=Candidatus Gottesmanbacteria bacterium RBG_13_45_10 TaxID=1798370 RepID=A0A1F5ZIW2_9BACT|nr:MAG: hypothetical protein A2Z00_04385 [Candidatus Gottesmanbacteria bacterium RBG_13_45_10]
MKVPIEDVEVIIWDVDGTLYELSEALSRDVRESEYLAIEKHTGWERAKTEEEFLKMYKKVTPSATEVVALICNIPTFQAAVETEQFLDRLKYLSRDEKLVALFEELRGFRHFILANGAKKNIGDALKALGIPISTFDEIVTSEVVGVNKPKDDGFLYILEKTSLPPSQHLMVGDREVVDLMPARKLGMKTCLVGSIKPSMVADITVPTVYDLAQIIL